MAYLYPVLLGLYPLLYLWSANRAQQPAYVILPALAASLVYLLAVLLLANLLFRGPQGALRGPQGALRGPHNAALAAALVSFDTLAYGQIAGWLSAHTGAPAGLLLALDLLLLAAALAWIALRRPARPGLSRVLGLFAVLLALMALVPAAYFYLFAVRPVSAYAAPPGVPVTGQESTPRRDVYFILIDNYSREDVFREHFGFDNSQLAAELKARGFVFPACPQGNYPGTALVVASTLNMDYLDTLGLPQEKFYEESRYQMLRPYIHNSAVIQKFSAYGYKTVTYRGYSDLIDIHNATEYVSYQKHQPITQRTETLNFQTLYFNTTLFSAANNLLDFYPHWVEAHVPPAVKAHLPGSGRVEDRYLQVYHQNIYALDELERLPAAMPAPKFVYAHLYAAHWPFMLNADGSLRQPVAHLEDEQAYLEGVRYLNSRLLHVIDTILAASDTPPVIILQSDHSNILEPNNHWAGADRVKIFNAYYLPGGGDRLLYDQITPVNNFRLVFNYYFGEKIDLLPDLTYGIDPVTQEVEQLPPTCLP